jgi:hypothetical protein
MTIRIFQVVFLMGRLSLLFVILKTLELTTNIRALSNQKQTKSSLNISNLIISNLEEENKTTMLQCQ